MPPVSLLDAHSRLTSLPVVQNCEQHCRRMYIERFEYPTLAYNESQTAAAAQAKHEYHLGHTFATFCFVTL